MSLINDGIVWIKAQIAECDIIVFVTEPYLYKDIALSAGKLIYSSIPLYNLQSIPVNKTKPTLYKTAYMRNGEIISPVNDTYIQQAAIRIGMNKGEGIDGSLVSLANCSIYEISWQIPLLSLEPSSDTLKLANQLGEVYAVDPRSIGLTGGLQLFPNTITKAHDVDVVIPVNNTDQLNKIHHFIESKKVKVVNEYGLRWPLRWYSSENLLICPFFIYGCIKPPILDLTPIERRVKGRITIVDVSYGIFNMPVYITKGVIGAVLFRSTLIRGLLMKGQELTIDCPIYTINAGFLSGSNVAVITDPWSETNSLEENVLHAWRC